VRYAQFRNNQLDTFSEKKNIKKDFPFAPKLYCGKVLHPAAKESV